MTTRHPLAWPVGWKRTLPHLRLRAKFGKGERQQIGDHAYTRKRDLTVAEGVRRVLIELQRLGVREGDAIISSNVPVRLDGLPRSDARKPDDPGVAVYWQRAGEPQRCMAIDRYDDVADNLAAIAATLNAMRAIERHGGAVILDRAFAGFTALPAPGAARPWREVLGINADEHPPRELVRLHYRRLAAEHHPDRGGSAERMAEINRAWKQALEELTDG